MNIFTNLTTKRQFKNLIESSDFLMDEINESHKPINNVIWHYKLNMINRPQDITLETLHFSINSATKHICELRNVYRDITSIYLANKKLLNKYHLKVKNVKQFFLDLIYNNEVNIVDIKRIDPHRINSDLMFVLNFLITSTKDLKQIVKYEGKIITNGIIV